ncbi:protoporphyrinogen oxidase [Paenibacillus peoriae]|uniref:protoporphyrinogen oxidase n=1 Tax=Paenibacillus peoriae TaxID=59893 RepID=UPI003F9E2E9B
MEQKLRNIVIVGGGLTGLSTAFYTRKMYKEAGYTPRITLVEKASVLGGKIETLHKDGFVIEKGPDSFLARKTAMIDLAKELELDHELVSTNPEAKKTYILHEGQLHPMPPGLVLGIPTELKPFLRSGLISLGGKMRAMMDFVLPPRRIPGDEALGDFIERRLGKEVLENVTEPLLAGIYAANMKTLSLQATFPQFAEVEQQYGSLIHGMMTGRKPAETHTGTKKSAFLTFRQGLQSLVHALLNDLYDCDLRTGIAVTEFTKTTESEGSPYRVMLDNGETLEADDIFVTTPNFAAAPLLLDHVNVAALEAVNYVSVANVVMAFDKTDIENVFDGSGFLVPRKEGRSVTACTWTSAKWLHTSPDDKVLLRCYVGRAGAEDTVELPDDELTALVRKDLKEMMGVTATPLFTEITRLRNSMPQYPVGHPQAIADLRKELRTAMPGVYVLGAGYDAIGLPDCIRQAKEWASNAVQTTQQEAVKVQV